MQKAGAKVNKERKKEGEKSTEWWGKRSEKRYREENDREDLES